MAGERGFGPSVSDAIYEIVSPRPSTGKVSGGRDCSLSRPKKAPFNSCRYRHCICLFKKASAYLISVDRRRMDRGYGVMLF